ncbi:DMSO/TMAO reductase YedYZ molybdopterin-dependent catalytic subunit [Streptosporangium becharense]|uniref:DMSO/TMAO reductase YedYZ molybdopterin-dependent catalytic subunit n=1 Tax=Streptosporangium becharense TaxID=1816182 RepID=A0A7W9IFA4_9ACTN|nr:molybdopterin-dependent oxidoreductase [Streptosporangium becharense]MBB2909991.1 DMSO/TMAO reductase YedYZ molybdopterin-dependent catalytic subunit [Streptosporangium becharense]MBB5819054.1 DMSO/TMAO reductase YedYZ molybdopterin-dependent catalytic subunit [Streptosporangium becharense]
MHSNRRMPFWAAALIGLVSGAVAVGVSLLAAGLVKASAFPVVAVGNAAVDLTPAALKDWAIRTFGENDKAVLLTGILLVLAGAAAAVGLLAARDIRRGLAGLAVFGVIGVAAVLTRPDAGPVDALPTLVGVGAAAFTLHRLTRRAFAPAGVPATAEFDDAGWHTPQEDLPAPDGTRATSVTRDAHATRPSDTVPQDRPEPAGRYVPSTPPVMRAGADRYAFDRRGLLTGVLGAAAVAGAGGLAGRMLSGRAEVGVARAGIALPGPAKPAPAIPAGADLKIKGLSSFITPNADFYRVDTALVVPQVDPADWTLTIHGMVDRPVEITFADLMKRTVIEADVTLCCVSNEVGGPYIGNARWLGVSLADVLRDAGVQKGADMLLSTSADGWTCGTPADVVLDGRNALLAFAMNGEALPVDHGFPVRQVVPGLYGYVSATKWVTDIKVTRFDQDEAYWTPRGWSAKGPVKTQSRIDLPKEGTTIRPGRTVIAGVAWAQHKGIDAVEVRVDRGPWRQARLAEAPTADTWRQWVIDDWEATPGTHTIEVRATDATGYTQVIDRTPIDPDGATGWHTVSVEVA